MSRDPVVSGLNNGNLYSYAGDSPINSVDPLGAFDVFGFGGSTFGPPGPIRPTGEGLGVVGYSSGQGAYVGGIATVGFEAGGESNYLGYFQGTESTINLSTGQTQSNSISIGEGSIGPEIPGITGVSAGVGTYDAGGESGVFGFISGGALGQHGTVGIGFSVPTSPPYWNYPPNTACLH